MSIESIEAFFNKDFDIIPSTRSYLEFFVENNDRVCTNDLIVKSFNYLGMDSRRYVSVAVNACRGVLEKYLISDFSIYSISHTASYLPTDTKKIGSWISLPLVEDKNMTNFFDDNEWKLLRQYEVRSDKLLVRRLSIDQLKVLWLLGDKAADDPLGYVKTGEIAERLFGVVNKNNLLEVNRIVSRMRSRLVGTNIFLEGNPQGGHKIFRGDSNSF